MNIGTIKQNENGTFIGRISTLTLDMTIALVAVSSMNPRAPRYEIHALSAARRWVRVGALFEQTANETGEEFFNGTIEDPSLDKPLYIAAFRQEDASYNVVWSRPTRRRDAPVSPMGGNDALPPLPGAETSDQPFGGEPGSDGLGESSAESPFAEGGKAQRGRREKTPEPVA